MRDDSGTFSRNFLSLQLQLKTMLEEAGGEGVAGLLDHLSNLSTAEQKVAIRVFERVLKDFMAQGPRFSDANDIERKRFEEQLYSELSNEMEAARTSISPGNHLEVIDGGRTRLTKAPQLIDLDSHRRSRPNCVSFNPSRKPDSKLFQ